MLARGTLVRGRRVWRRRLLRPRCARMFLEHLSKLGDRLRSSSERRRGLPVALANDAAEALEFLLRLAQCAGSLSVEAVLGFGDGARAVVLGEGARPAAGKLPARVL